MTTAYYSTVLDHPLETVWTLIRDFNNYPAYIDGVSESIIEDDRGGDEVGAAKRPDRRDMKGRCTCSRLSRATEPSSNGP